MRISLAPYAYTLTRLYGLRSAFMRHGFDIRLVGGCVRDMLHGVTPADFDICTDANPDEQRMIYEAENIRHIDTGLQHGTYTVVIEGETYEITSLRTETDHDGRWATVSYTKDWLGDLARRDLTVNAMALTFDGDLIDPFNGADDLRDGVVRFVGNAEERIREDYLRILRWFRFSARYALTLHAETCELLRKPEIASGLKQISRERVWAEIRKMLVGPKPSIVLDIVRLGIAEYIDFPMPPDETKAGHRLTVSLQYTYDPVSLMVAYCGPDADTVCAMEQHWKWSTAESQQASLIREHAFRDDFDFSDAKRLVALGANQDWIAEALHVSMILHHPRQSYGHVLKQWHKPVFPVTGGDIVAAGIAPGPEVGRLYRKLREAWIASDYKLSKETLLSMEKDNQ